MILDGSFVFRDYSIERVFVFVNSFFERVFVILSRTFFAILLTVPFSKPGKGYYKIKASGFLFSKCFHSPFCTYLKSTLFLMKLLRKSPLVYLYQKNILPCYLFQNYILLQVLCRDLPPSIPVPLLSYI